MSHDAHLPWPPPAAAPDPTPDPVVPPTPLVKEEKRPHPLTPVVRGWGVLAALLIGLVREYRPGEGIYGIPLESWRFLAFGGAGVVVLAVVAGLGTWWFTRYVIDAEEVRVESGWLNRQTRQIAVDRIQSVDVIQPLLARMLGMAEVKIDVGADASTRLRYLSRSDAYAMRDLLLAHAHGHDVVVDPASGTLLQRLQDTTVDETTLVTVAPGRLVLSAVLSMELFAAIAGSIALVLLGLGTKDVGWGLAAILPIVLGGFKVVSDRVLAQWGYRLATGPRGLKITRGLTSLTSQSVPVHRIQGIRLSQPLVWRPLQMYRVDVDVLGYGHLTSDEDDSGTSTILLPAGSIDDVATVLRHTLPGLDLTDLVWHGASPKARWFHPIGWRAMRWAATADHLIAEIGPWSRQASIVPHARVQSMELHQGPIDQRLGIATLQAATPDGPVDLWIKQVPLADAVVLVPTELDRASACRRAELARVDRAGIDAGRRLLA